MTRVVYLLTKLWLKPSYYLSSSQNYSNNICIGRRCHRRFLMLQFNKVREKPFSATRLLAGSIPSDAPVRQWRSVDKLGARYDLFMNYIPLPILLWRVWHCGFNWAFTTQTQGMSSLDLMLDLVSLTFHRYRCRWNKYLSIRAKAKITWKDSMSFEILIGILVF